MGRRLVATTTDKGMDCQADAAMHDEGDFLPEGSQGSQPGDLGVSGEDYGAEALEDAFQGLGSLLDEEAMKALGGEVTTYLSPLDLQEEATKDLEGYREAGSCILLGSGYLGITGSSWGCLVQGDGWVEVRVVSQVEGDDGSRVMVAHMDVEEWRLALEQSGEEGE